MFEIIEEPDGEPISVAEFKSHERITNSAEDTLILTYIKTARKQVEAITSLALITQQLRQRYLSFGSSLVLPRGPVSDTGSLEYDITILYTTELGDQEELTDFQVRSDIHPPRVVPAYQQSFPVTRAVVDAVILTYTAGYGEADDVPEDLRTAVRILAAHYFLHRDVDAPIPRQVWQLVSEYRTWF